MRIGVVHGPNLNLLGTRQPEIYGRRTLEEIEESLRARAAEYNVELASLQSNSEGEIIDWIQSRTEDVEGWLVNAAGLTHSSVSLRDALLASGKPFVEVHLSNTSSRESFRHRSVLADAAAGVIAGFRGRSYVLGLEGLLSHLSTGE